MALKFRTGKSSSKFALTLLTESAAKHGVALADSQEWREHYQQVFAQLTAIEELDQQAALQAELLARLHNEIVDETGRTLGDLVRAGFDSKELDNRLETGSIAGIGQVSQLATIGKPTAENLIAQQLAEPGLLSDLESYDHAVASGRVASLLDDTLFVAIGANAELALTEELLSIGAHVVAVARANPEKWQRLQEFASGTAGTVTYPVFRGQPGLALDTQIDLTANWLSRVVRAHPKKRVVCLGFVYAPGSAQIIAAAAQDALIAALANEVGAERFVAGWLATPLDSYCVNRDVFEANLEAFAHRSVFSRVRDALIGLGRARAVSASAAQGFPSWISQGLLEAEKVVVDFSAKRQGSSYLLSKRIERWRASELSSRGFGVWFQVTPAAQTRSTLDYKFVRAAYRGLARLGVVTFEAWMLRDLLTACLLGRLAVEPNYAQNSASNIAKFAQTAIHGRLWRMPYRMEQLWVSSFLLGLDEYLRR